MADNTTVDNGDLTDYTVADEELADGSKLQSVELHSEDSGTKTKFGTASNPVRTNPTGTTAQPVTDNGGTLSVDDGGASITVDGTVAVTQPVAVTDNGGSLTVDDGGSSITVDGSVTAVASGDHTVVGKAADGAATSGNPVLVAGQDGTNVQSIKTDAAGELQVDVLTLPALPAGTNNIGDVDVLTVPAPLSTTGGGTEATAHRVTIANDSTGVLSVDDNGGSLTVDGTVTAVASGDHTVVGKAADGAAVAGNPVLIAGQDGTNAQSIKTDANGELQVDVLTLPAIPAGTNNIGDVDVLTVPSPLSTAGGGTEAAALRVTVANDSTGVLSVDDNGSTLSVDDGAGSLTVDGTVTANQGSAGTAWEVVGDVAHDATAPGNPVVVGGQMETMADSAPATRAGTDTDAVKLASTDGALYVVPTAPQTWSYHSDGSSALTDATVHAAPGSGLSLYVTDIVVSTGAATALNVFFEEGSTKVLGPYYLEAVAGRGFAIRFQTPKKITANTALTVTTSAAIAQAVDVTGFIAPG